MTWYTWLDKCLLSEYYFILSSGISLRPSRVKCIMCHVSLRENKMLLIKLWYNLISVVGEQILLSVK